MPSCHQCNATKTRPSCSVSTIAKTMATKKGALWLFNFATCKLELPQFHIIPWAPDGTCKTEQKQIGKFYAWFTNRAPTLPHPHPIWTRGFENPAMFAFKQISTNFLYNQIGVWRGEGEGCEAAITPNTFGGHYGASHAEWLLQAETLLTLFKVDLMKASIQCSSLVWARDSTHSEITHSGPGLGGWCLEFFLFKFMSV